MPASRPAEPRHGIPPARDFLAIGHRTSCVTMRPARRPNTAALLSAAKLGRLWPFTLLVYKRFDSFTPAALPEWAAAAGIDRAAFEREFSDPKTRDELVASKQEGLRNKVTATPGIFIDGWPYLYEMNMEAMLDVLEEAYDAKVAARK